MTGARLAAAAAGLALALAAAPAAAEGELRIYSWADYTAPELIAAFEEETDIRVALEAYESNAGLLAALRAGAGYDIVVPAQNVVPILIDEGLIQPIEAAEIDGYDNIEPRWRSPAWDPGNRYTVPWQWGTTAFSVDGAVYGGEIDSYALLFEPPPALRGKVGMFGSRDEVLPMAALHLGLPLCSESLADMAALLALLERQKPQVKVYDSAGIVARLSSGETAVHSVWNGHALRARLARPALRYAYPAAGVLAWLDSLAVPSGAPNRDNALEFIAFVLEPENAALQSNHTGYANAIAGSAEYLSEDLRDAPELNPPEGIRTVFAEPCSPEAEALAERVWAKLMQ